VIFLGQDAEALLAVVASDGCLDAIRAQHLRLDSDTVVGPSRLRARW
jgi:hypothetical protein